jgi:hypothetical protein
MKTNLDGIFKTDSNLEKDGVWVEVAPGVKFCIRRFGGDNSLKMQAANNKYFKPVARLVQNNSLDKKMEKELIAKVYFEACIVTWSGLKDESGDELAVNLENAVKLFDHLPELFNTLFEYSQRVENFREDLGNS